MIRSKLLHRHVRTVGRWMMLLVLPGLVIASEALGQAAPGVRPELRALR